MAQSGSRAPLRECLVALFKVAHGSHISPPSLAYRPDLREGGGLAMPARNQLTKTENFKFALVLQVEGSSARSMLVRMIGVATTLVAAAVKIALIIASRAS